MPIHASPVAPAGPPEAPGPAAAERAVLRARLRVDRAARVIVVGGGMTIIAGILAILAVLLAEVVPLFRAPAAAPAGTIAPSEPARPLLAGTEEYREFGYVLDVAGRLRFVSLQGAAAPDPILVGGPPGARLTAIGAAGEGRFLAGTADGRGIPIDVTFDVSFDAAGRRIVPGTAAREALDFDPEGSDPVLVLAYAEPPGGALAAAQVKPGGIVLLRVRERRALGGGSRRETSSRALRLPSRAEVTAMAIDERGQDLYVGTAGGRVLRYALEGHGGDEPVEAVDAASRPGAGISVLGFLLGDRTLVAGDTRGGVGTFQVVPIAGGGVGRLTRIHAFEPHGAAVTAFAPSRRDKGFVTADASGTVRLRYGTTGDTLLSIAALPGPIAAAGMAPRGDGMVLADARGGLAHWTIHNPHPEAGLRAFFGRVWYEGYRQPEHVWQSTGGTDDFEPKLGLTPLVFGTLKGTFYTLLFAVPLALLGALYTSQFMHPSLKGVVKPAVEIMAALPSVVLGFIAGLWLAPIIEKIVPGLVLMPVVVPLLILAALSAWRALPASFTGRRRPGSELALLLPVVVAGCALSLWAGVHVEQTLLSGDYRTWLREALGLVYDQRNSIVVGVAMGFAVVPIIFTIAEDSLTNVPRHLTAASLALGATRWQTALRVVLPTASPGIFSAIMIGFGRAVGETMIVLMATGNTPIMDWSIFNGFRALSANIAVELPEAPDGGTLFRVLFLAALLLFAMTFVVNTAAELVRLRLRQRYRVL